MLETSSFLVFCIWFRGSKVSHLCEPCLLTYKENRFCCYMRLLKGGKTEPFHFLSTYGWNLMLTLFGVFIYNFYEPQIVFPTLVIKSARCIFTFIWTNMPALGKDELPTSFPLAFCMIYVDDCHGGWQLWCVFLHVYEPKKTKNSLFCFRFWCKIQHSE